MHLTLVGLSHHTAPVDVRDQAVLTKTLQEKALSFVKSSSGILEAVLLSTCNRSEMYATTDEEHTDPRPIEAWFHEIHGLDEGVLSPYLYHRKDDEAIRHLFRVVSSLDSLVVGEQQILGQVREAYMHSLNTKTTGLVLNRLFEKALAVGKQVRETTEIGAGAVSVSSVAVELARKIFKDLRQHTAMLIGAGETGERTAEYLVDQGVKRLIVANRTYERAADLAHRFDGIAVSLHDGLQMISDVDIVISSTGATEPVLGRDRMADVMHDRRNRPIFLIDIAAPRDIDPRVRDLYNVILYDMDDLQSVLDDNAEARKVEARKVEGIVEREVDRFLAWYQNLAITPTITQLRHFADGVRHQEVDRALAQLGHLSEKDRETVDKMSRAIVNKLLHQPTVQLRSTSDPEHKDYHLYSLRHLFGLDEQRNDRNGAGNE